MYFLPFLGDQKTAPLDGFLMKLSSKTSLKILNLHAINFLKKNGQTRSLF